MILRHGGWAVASLLHAKDAAGFDAGPGELRRIVTAARSDVIKFRLTSRWAGPPIVTEVREPLARPAGLHLMAPYWPPAPSPAGGEQQFAFLQVAGGGESGDFSVAVWATLTPVAEAAHSPRTACSASGAPASGIRSAPTPTARAATAGPDYLPGCFVPKLTGSVLHSVLLIRRPARAGHPAAYDGGLAAHGSRGMIVSVSYRYIANMGHGRPSG
jgi:hypothetical protein